MSQIMAAPIIKKALAGFSIYVFKLILIYIDHVLGNKISIPAVKHFPILLFFFPSYAC